MQVQQNLSAAMPPIHMTNPDFMYVSAAATDVRRTFEKHGWSVPDRAKQRAMKRRLNPILNDDALDALN